MKVELFNLLSRRTALKGGAAAAALAVAGVQRAAEAGARRSARGAAADSGRQQGIADGCRLAEGRRAVPRRHQANVKEGEFKGVELTFMGLNNQNLHNLLFRGFLKPWEAYTGAKINWIDLAQADYNPRLQQAIATGTVDFDIVEMGAPFEGDVCGKGLASVMPDWVKQQIEMDDYVGYLKAPVGTWDGKTYRISIDGDCHNFNYRTDYFSDAELADAWKSEGPQGEWGVPKTWQQVQEVTKFLKGKKVGGQDAYGYLDPIKGWGGFGFYFLGSRATAYAKHPDDKAWLFDPDTMKPRINNPAWVRAIQDVIDALPSEPADQLNADPGHHRLPAVPRRHRLDALLVGRRRLQCQDQRQLGRRRRLRLLDPPRLGRRLQFEDRRVGQAGERPELRAQHGLYRLGRLRDGPRRQ